jgi:hypothetical protein
VSASPQPHNMSSHYLRLSLSTGAVDVVRFSRQDHRGSQLAGRVGVSMLPGKPEQTHSHSTTYN